VHGRPQYARGAIHARSTHQRIRHIQGLDNTAREPRNL